MFDPRSILPATKPKKSLSRLLEASSSSSANKVWSPSSYSCIMLKVLCTQQPAAFQCIDGAVRTADQSEPVLNAPRITFRFDEYIAAPEAQQHGDDEQFTAFGIKAFPTRAIFNDICYDFVHPLRWCPHANKCTRVHPLNKHEYRHTATQEHRLFSRMRSRTIGGNNPPQGQVVGAPAARDPAPRVQLPTMNSAHESGLGTRHRSTRSVPMARTSSAGNVEDWDEITGLNPSHAAASSSSGSLSDSSSEPGESDCGAWVEPVQRISDWSGEKDLDCEEFAGYMHAPVQKKVVPRQSYTSVDEPPLAKRTAKASEEPPMKRPVISHSRPRNSERCRKWLQNRCFLGYDYKFVHDGLEYDEDVPVPYISFLAIVGLMVV